MRGARTRRRRNPRFAALCLLLIFAAVGAAVWLWAGRGLPGEGVEVPDYVQADLLTVNRMSPTSTPASHGDLTDAILVAASLDICLPIVLNVKVGLLLSAFLISPYGTRPSLISA